MNNQIYVECIKIKMQKEQMEMKEIFGGWRKSGICRVQKDQQNAGQYRIELEGNPAEKRENVKIILDKMEQKLQGNFAIILEIILPQNLCGYVVGKGGNTIQNFNNKFNVQTEFEKEKENIPNGFSRMRMESFQVANVRNGYFDLLRMADYATNSAETKAKTMKTKAFGGQKQKDGNEFEVKVKVPAFHKLTEEQREKFRQIGESFGLMNIPREPCTLGDHYELWVLKGHYEKLLQANKKMIAFTNEIEEQQEEEESKNAAKIAEQMATKGQSNNSPHEKGKIGLVMAPKSPVKTAKIGLVMAPKSPVKTAKIGLVTAPKSPVKTAKIGLITVPVKKNLVASTSKPPVQILAEPIPKRPMPKEWKEMGMTTIPEKIVPIILGQNGETKRQIERKFGVKMLFAGDNHLEYPDGRTLEIYAESKEQIKMVEDYIEEEFIVQINKKYNKRHQISCESEWDGKVVVPYEMIIWEEIEAWMVAMKKRTGITTYVYRALPDGNREIRLKGQKEAVDLAEKELKAEAEIFVQNGRKSNDISALSDPPMDPSPPPMIPNYSESSAIVENKLDDDAISIFTMNDFNPSKGTNLAKMNNLSKLKSKPMRGPIKNGNDSNASKDKAPKHNESETMKCVKCKKGKRDIVCVKCFFVFLCHNCSTANHRCPNCGQQKIRMLNFGIIDEEMEEE